MASAVPTFQQQNQLVNSQTNIANVEKLILGLADLPTRYDQPVRNFLAHYLGTPSQPAPFGGRRADLAALDAWLQNASAPPYALLAAPAGRGKSALLAHWITALQDNAHVVFFPISIRYNTNRENVVFAALAARLARLLNKTVGQTSDAQLYRGVFHDLLTSPPADGRRVVVVLDGLDEATGWEVGADLFPAAPPAHLRVVVAARFRTGDSEGQGWLTQLGWEAPGAAQLLHLDKLDLPGVRDVLAQMGNPLGALAAQMDVVAMLHRLSDGDPLLVRLYVEALIKQGNRTAFLKPEDLQTLKPGLKPYFDRWYEEQETWIHG